MTKEKLESLDRKILTNVLTKLEQHPTSAEASKVLDKVAEYGNLSLDMEHFNIFDYVNTVRMADSYAINAQNGENDMKASQHWDRVSKYAFNHPHKFFRSPNLHLVTASYTIKYLKHELKKCN